MTNVIFQEHHVRQSLVEKFEKEFPPKEYGLTFAIGKTYDQGLVEKTMQVPNGYDISPGKKPCDVIWHSSYNCFHGRIHNTNHNINVSRAELGFSVGRGRIDMRLGQKL